jgi:hypothetical protein
MGTRNCLLEGDCGKRVGRRTASSYEVCHSVGTWLLHRSILWLSACVVHFKPKTQEDAPGAKAGLINYRSTAVSSSWASSSSGLTLACIIFSKGRAAGAICCKRWLVRAGAASSIIAARLPFQPAWSLVDGPFHTQHVQPQFRGFLVLFSINSVFYYQFIPSGLCIQCAQFFLLPQGDFVRASAPQHGQSLTHAKTG